MPIAPNQILYMFKTDLSSFNNSWYKPGAALIKQMFWYFTNVFLFKNPLNPASGFKRILLKFFGAKVGKGVVIKPGVNIKYPWKLSIGDYTWIGENVWIDNLDYVNIGNNVCISQGAMLLCGNHNYKKPTFDLMIGEINIEDGSWIGAQCVVCPGVTIKTHAVLSVGSVASKDLLPYQIYKGNPAIAIKSRI